MTDNIFTIDGGKKDEVQKYISVIDYSDGAQEYIVCTFVGVSPDIPNFVIFHDEDSIEANMPKKLVATHLIRAISTLPAQDIDVEYEAFMDQDCNSCWEDDDVSEETEEL